MGLKPRFTEREVRDYVNQKYLEAEKKLIEILKYVGEGFVKEARSMTKEMGGFGDVTGNLRSSIGYLIVKNGRIIQETIYLSNKGTDRNTGVEAGKRFGRDISTDDGLYLYGIAGMNYADDVESKGYNVISLQSDLALIELREILSRVR